jgi:hypothetical protein
MPRTEQTPKLPSLRVAGFEALRGGWFWAPDDNHAYPHAKELLITADSGGSNGSCVHCAFVEMVPAKTGR